MRNLVAALWKKRLTLLGMIAVVGIILVTVWIYGGESNVQRVDEREARIGQQSANTVKPYINAETNKGDIGHAAVPERSEQLIEKPQEELSSEQTSEPGALDRTVADNVNRMGEHVIEKDETSADKLLHDELSEQTNEEVEVQSSTIRLTIVGSPDMGTIMETVVVEISDSETVLEVLKRVTREAKLQLEYRGSGASAYVEGIDNLYEFDRGPGSGWMYSVNQKFPNRSAGVWPVHDGDHVRWLYTDNLGEDLGAGQEDGLWDGEG